MRGTVDIQCQVPFQNLLLPTYGCCYSLSYPQYCPLASQLFICSFITYKNSNGALKRCYSLCHLPLVEQEIWCICLFHLWKSSNNNNNLQATFINCLENARPIPRHFLHSLYDFCIAPCYSAILSTLRIRKLQIYLVYLGSNILGNLFKC
jgi:hypothetical protein